MYDYKILGNNIRELRKFYGLSQEELARNLHFSGRAVISNYENCKRTPDSETISVIAKYFMVSEEQLTSQLFQYNEMVFDYYRVKKIFYKNIYVILPIFCSDEALMNEQFKRAFLKHQELYDVIIKKGIEEGIELFDTFTDIINKYIEALNDINSEIEAISNLLSIYLIDLNIFGNYSMVINEKNAIVDKVEGGEEIIEELRQDEDKKVFEDIIKSMKNRDIKKWFYSMLKILKENNKFDLSEYYMALVYIFGGINDDNSYIFYNQVGYEMMRIFKMTGNKYAKTFLTVIDDIVLTK